MKAQKFIPLLLIVVGLVAYHNIFRNGFVFDDGVNIVENARIKHLWPPWQVLAHSSRPVVTLSLAVNYALGGLKPWGYHAVNVAIHILAALTLYGAVRRTLISETLRAKWGEAASWVAGAVAAIWMVHPLQTESVTYTIQRGESLMGLFYLATVYSVIRSDASSRRHWWQAAAVASCALGMGSKQVMITAPVVVAIFDRVFLARSWRGVIRQRWALHVGLAATWLWLPALMAKGPLETPGWVPTAGFAYKDITPLQYALTQPGVILHYLRLVFWPAPLCLDYGWYFGWPLVHSVAKALPSLLVVGGLGAATVWALWRKLPLGFLGVWFFVILAPTSSFVPVADVVFEHRMYLPLAAAVILVVMAVREFSRVWARRWPRMEHSFGWGMSGVTILALTALTLQRNLDYRSEFTIWQDTVRKCPNNPRAQSNFGNTLLHTGRNQEAIPHYEQALRLNPNYTDAQYNLGVGLRQAGKVEEAISHFEQALKINPNYMYAHNNLGSALMQVGRLPEALAHLARALQLNPNSAEAHNNLGMALVQTGKPQEALAHLARALQLNPDSAEAHNNLGMALVQTGKPQEALAHIVEALKLKPEYAEAHNNWASALLQLGQTQEAIRHIEQALRLKPDYAEAHYNLGLAVGKSGQIQEETNQYRQALQFKTDFAEPHNNWGTALLQMDNVPEAINHYEQAVRINPNYAEAHHNLAVALGRAGRVQEAISHYEQALKIKPDYVEAREHLAWLLATQRQAPKAAGATP